MKFCVDNLLITVGVEEVSGYLSHGSLSVLGIYHGGDGQTLYGQLIRDMTTLIVMLLF
jgi:hypothetical protein